MSLLVTRDREEPQEEVQAIQEGVNSAKMQLFPLTDASINHIASTTIKDCHPWNQPEVFF